ncbi:MAG TPA: hypothetical protein VHO24_05190 [Opitutaceae bacterium]|nr:hypothetical protein [Opitutaceae bacterium]
MNSREEIKRVLAASGEPVPLRGDTARAVRARIAAPHLEIADNARWSWLPRGWELACACGFAVALGVVSAEWRVRRSEAAAPIEHRRYLASIDPTVAAFPGKRP